ncbi:hypothetical protein [Pseudomonas sp. GV071]|uniref:hypothetical protein n=1 Tax=Pseudomonas sp. GV071 TaxID=2135754 RepID=UPI000D36FD1C|nr:hypothetical protein [Pseudomonas sp. GV071]
MNAAERWEKLVALDDEFLAGGVVLSEWCCVIVRDTDLAFANGANLSAVLMAVAAVETYFRAEDLMGIKHRLVELINSAAIDDELKADLHTLRRYRNKWVHVDEPLDDISILQNPESLCGELEQMALFAVRALRKVIYSAQCV